MWAWGVSNIQHPKGGTQVKPRVDLSSIGGERKRNCTGGQGLGSSGGWFIRRLSWFISRLCDLRPMVSLVWVFAFSCRCGSVRLVRPTQLERSSVRSSEVLGMCRDPQPCPLPLCYLLPFSLSPTKILIPVTWHTHRHPCLWLGHSTIFLACLFHILF